MKPLPSIRERLVRIHLIGTFIFKTFAELAHHWQIIADVFQPSRMRARTKGKGMNRRHYLAMHCGHIVCAGFMLFGLVTSAHAEFILDQAIVEFNATSGMQKDIDLVSRSETSDYVVTEVYEVFDAGLPSERKELIDDPAKAGMLVTPDKTILPGGGRQVLRFVLLQALTDHERIFRVAVKPVINGVNSDAKMGLKVLIGYEVLVILRPAVIAPQFTVTRKGKMLTVANRGNSNVLLQAGQQCLPADASNCRPTTVVRIYPQQMAEVALPYDTPLTVSLWDGKDMQQRDVH